MCSFEGIILMARWLSWLERRPVTAEVEGSNPFRVVDTVLMYQSYNENGILAQLGEHLPYKQRVTGSSPVGPINADMAQLAEQLICNQQVIGSSPIVGFMDGFPSGQRGQTVNLLSTTSKVRILLHPLNNIAGWSSLEARRAHNPKVVGSNPAPATLAQIAQSVEQRTENPRVAGSIPALGTLRETLIIN